MGRYELAVSQAACRVVGHERGNPGLDTGPRIG